MEQIKKFQQQNNQNFSSPRITFWQWITGQVIKFDVWASSSFFIISNYLSALKNNWLMDALEEGWSVVLFSSQMFERFFCVETQGFILYFAHKFLEVVAHQESTLFQAEGDRLQDNIFLWKLMFLTFYFH